MKKYSLSFAIFSFLLVCISCHTTKKASDNSSESIRQLKEFEIDPQTAERMIDWFTACKDSCRTPEFKIDRLGISNKIKRAFPQASVEEVPARFTKGDELIYCTTRRFPNGSEACKVANYSTVLTKVTGGNSTGGNTPTYYSYRRICPPPPTCNPVDSLK